MTTPLEQFGQFMSWNGTDLMIDTSDDRAAKLRKKALSPSTANAFGHCQARWAVGQLMPRDDDPMSPAGKGTAAHAVLEEMFKMDPAARTPQVANEIIATIETLNPGITPPTDELTQTTWRGILGGFIAPLWRMMDPAKINVVAIERHLEGTTVADVPINGYIDLQVDTGVIDWKFPGKPPRTYSARSKIVQDYHEQLRVYAMAVANQDGKMPPAASLAYVNHQMAVAVDLSAPQLDATKERFTNAWTGLNDSFEQGRYTTTKHQLCGWCPLVSVCPSAQADNVQARTDAARDGIAMNIPTTLTTQRRTMKNEPEPQPPIKEEAMTYAEQPPYILTLPNKTSGVLGSFLNPNSYGAGGIAGLQSKAYELLKAQDAVECNLSTTHALAHAMYSVISLAQTQLIGSDPGPNTGLSTRMRGFLYTRIDIVPPPFGGDQDAWNAWLNASVEFVKAMAGDTFAIYDEGASSAGVAVLAVQSPAAESN